MGFRTRVRFPPGPLKKDGIAIFGTYGNNHMKEISELVTKFDDRIVLSADSLYEKFGKENGKENFIKEVFLGRIYAFGV